MTHPIWERLAGEQADGEAAGGLVRVRVDGTGDLLELVIEPKAMKLGSAELAEAVQQAFRQAYDRVQELVSVLATGVVADLDGMTDTLTELSVAAHQRLDELSQQNEELLRHVREL